MLIYNRIATFGEPWGKCNPIIKISGCVRSHFSIVRPSLRFCLQRLPGRHRGPLHRVKSRRTSSLPRREKVFTFDTDEELPRRRQFFYLPLYQGIPRIFLPLPVVFIMFDMFFILPPGESFFLHFLLYLLLPGILLATSTGCSSLSSAALIVPLWCPF